MRWSAGWGGWVYIGVMVNVLDIYMVVMSMRLGTPSELKYLSRIKSNGFTNVLTL